MKINFNNLKYSLSISALVTVTIVMVVATLCYIAKFYSWLFTTYSPVVAAVVLALVGFLICVIGSYINMEMKERRNDT